MAEQVQSILERMVPPLKDLRDRGIFSRDEIRAIVERRRRSEYLLQRRSAARKGDYLRYVEDEILLERLRKLRKERVLTEIRDERIRQREQGDSDEDGVDDDGEEGRKHAYQTSGPGDSHVVSHIHFLYQRMLRKFGYPLDVVLNYAQFSKDHKSFHMLGRIYAEGLQRHPHEVGLWIEAASFEYFGYVAQDYGEGKAGGVNSKVVGSSIQNARVLMQRGLRINKTSVELWLQYFALELHYVQKLRGRREILEIGMEEGGMPSTAGEEEEGSGEAENDREGKTLIALLPSRIIFKNAIKNIPGDIRFRLQFLETCLMFPQTEKLEEFIMDSVTRDFGNSVEAWVARISYAEEKWQKKKLWKKGRSSVAGFLGLASVGADREDGSSKGENEEDRRERPAKKARVEERDPALILLKDALDAVPSPNMYLEGARFLHFRIQRLIDKGQSNVQNEEEEDLSHLIGRAEDCTRAAQRHAHLLEKLFEKAKMKDISSPNLTLNKINFLVSTGQLERAEETLRNAVSSSTDTSHARLWLKWADVSQRMEGAGLKPSSLPIHILRRGLRRTPIHDRGAHTLILMELMQRLMAKPSSLNKNEELKSLFQKLLLLSQGSRHSFLIINKSGWKDDSDDDKNVTGRELNAASIFLSFLEYTLLNSTGEATRNDNVRLIYTSVLYNSNYGRSCSDKTEEEALSMKSFFDLCVQFEKTNCDNDLLVANKSSASTLGNRKMKNRKQKKKVRLCNLYEAAIGFYECGGSSWTNVVDTYQKGLNDVKYSL